MNEFLGTLKTELAEIDPKLDRKEFPSAGKGRKAYQLKESEIERAAAMKLNENKTTWTKRIETTRLL